MARSTTPVSTYRFQVRPEFGFADVAARADHLAALGVTHAYLSPVLTPVEGSQHGYDVLDHTRLNPEAGGREAFDAMAQTLRDKGIGVVVDVVPNHMAVPTPEWGNAPLWDVLRHGREAAHAHWFDVDWDVEDGRILVPVLGATLEEALEGGELALARDGGPGGDETVVRYYDHEVPVAPGTEDLPLLELLERQHWRLAHWREGTTALNYRRFFDVTTLIGVRVEVPDVFEATHALLGELVASGQVAGLRVDHPDGLADPRGYLRDLERLTDGAWVVVEKILEGDEGLTSDWPCAGTTGYDLLWRVGALFVDPAGEEPLTELLATTTGSRISLSDSIRRAKQEVVGTVLPAEVHRLRRALARVLPTEDAGSLERVLGELLVVMDRYRAYVVPGEAPDEEALTVLTGCADRAREHLDEADHATLLRVTEVLAGRAPEGADEQAVADVVVRFQQTCGPVMAKGIEDTAFYRYHRLVALNEVGGDPDHFSVSPEELFSFVERTATRWPTTMTTLSTHDTKRSEDVRARLLALSEHPAAWRDWLREAQELARPLRGEPLDGATEYLLWQTVVGAWPISEERLLAYARKAIREDKTSTRWTDPDEAYEAAVDRFVTGVLADDRLVAHVEAWVERTAVAARATTLGQKLLQLVLPGVPDVYQGNESLDLSLVDPDNRREVDFADRATRLARLDGGAAPADLADEKLLVTSRALRLRREHPQWFVGDAAAWQPVPTTSDHLVAVGRGTVDRVEVVAVVTRLAGSLATTDPWEGVEVHLPEGRWRDLLTDRPVTSGGSVAAADVMGDLPVVLLVREEGR
ncbi:malto-oligosyltrehalose synthase [Lapillicoccus jejuensis]|uniref:Maltooligosyl trehalose synthase n=1 Tax=Lapillicoccus jejuensis TaxID=402171 RepID=A0A542E2V4_9MICO|nr:malto-oligosyltrehalose synthase [Lapillicoccus jejuensis]TQJ09652.1 maltooligosyl trehalose synthase [Lapillicoccus jejuensis]